MTSRILLGRYELTRLIGRGGMAEVWEAHDTRLDRRVAVKVVNLAATHDPTVAERLRREAVAIASLRHPDIVTVHDAGVEGDIAYLVMELIEGTDLVAVLRDGPLPVPLALRVAERVAGALSAAHAAGPIPTGMYVHHTCGRGLCINPDHLEAVTPAQSNRYREGANSSNSSSGVRGVTWIPERGRWKAQAHHDGCCHFGGYHDDLASAAAAARDLRERLLA